MLAWLAFGMMVSAPVDEYTMTTLLSEIRRIIAMPNAIVVQAHECDLENYEQDLRTEYRAPSVLKRGAEGRIRYHARKAGRFFIGFVFYDDGNSEEYTVSVDGNVIGRVRADANDNRQHLCIFTRAVELRDGSVVEIVARGRGAGRVESIVLLPMLPMLKQREHRIKFIHARIPFNEPLRAVVTWVTTWAVKCTLEYGADGKFEHSIAEDAPLCNHRIILTNLREGVRYNFRIRATLPDGREVIAEGEPFVARIPKPPRSKVHSQRVQIKVDFPDGARVNSFPIAMGVPFPQGSLGDAAQVRVLSHDGSEIPSHTRPLGWWADGSIKWLLIDFIASAGNPIYMLEFGRDVKRRAQLPSDATMRVTDDGKRIVVQNRILQLTFDRDRCGIITEVRFDPHGKFAQRSCIARDVGAVLVDADGNKYHSDGTPIEIAVEESSPLRVVVRIRGKYRRGDATLFCYTARVHIFADAPFVRIFYTFGNDVVDDLFTTIRSLQLRIPTTLREPPNFAIGTDGNGCVDGKGDVRLFQDYDDHFTVMRTDGEVLATGKRASGWLEVRDDARKVLACARWFWQLYPKALSVDGTALSIGLCPILPDGAYTSESDRENEDKLFFYLVNGRYKLKRGVEKTHEIWLAFGNANDDLQQFVPCFVKPPIGIAPAKWYCGSGAFRDVIPRDEENFYDYERAVMQALDAYLANREFQREYGMLNFGDWYGERTYNWGNHEYDTPHCFLLQFARTGERGFFDIGEEAVWHMMDVDMVHYHKDARMLGAVYVHSLCHVGDYYPSGYKPPSIPREGFTVSHTWVQGLIDYYFLTGCSRALEAARMIADRYDTYYTINYDFTNCRIPGWHLILTLGMYEATGDEFYLNSARIIVERVLERREPNGGWIRCLVPGHCRCMPRHKGAAGFMVGILLSGLKRYHLLTGDDKVARAIVDAARWIVADTWMPDREAFRYTSCPNTGTISGNMLWEGIAYAVRLSGDEHLQRVLLTDMRNEIGRRFGRGRGLGKSISMFLRFSPYVLHEFLRVGEKLLPYPFHALQWDEHTRLCTSPKGDSGRAPDIVEVHAQVYKGDLVVLVRFADANYIVGKNSRGDPTIWLRLFLNTDGNRKTGYMPDEIGVEFMVECNLVGGSGAVLQHCGKAGEWSWKRVKSANAFVSDDKTAAVIKFPLKALGDVREFEMLVQTDLGFVKEGEDRTKACMVRIGDR